MFCNKPTRKTSLKGGVATAALVIATLGFAAPTQAGTVVWGNNAGSGADVLESFDISTGAILDTITTVHQGNGRGIAVVGNTIYYSTANDGHIWKVSASTHADLGTFVDTGFGGNGVATVAFDGTNFYATGYQGNNNTNVYDVNGNFVRTFSGLGNGRDGFEVANNHIVANRGDLTGPYDQYDLNAVLTTSNFLVDPNTNSDTGVTFDGTDYYVSEVLANSIAIFDINGTYIRTQLLAGSHLLEDLSALGNVPNNPPPGVPEPATLSILGIGLAALGLARRRKSA